MENSEDYLTHYGVLGMKWGVRKAEQYEKKASQTSDPEKRAKLKKKARDSRYKSWSTKRYERKALKTENSQQKALYKQRAKRSAELDAKESKHAESVSTGKTVAIRAITAGGSIPLSKPYHRYQALGVNKGISAALTYLGGYPASMLTKAVYIRQDEEGVKEVIKNTKNSSIGKAARDLNKVKL